MSEINSFSIVALVFFFLSMIFVIRPLSFHVRLPIIRRTRITTALMTAPIIILWASQCIGATQIRNGIVGTDGIKPYNILILSISLAYMAISLDVIGILQAAAFWVSNQGGNNGTRKPCFYFYVLLTGISCSMVVGIILPEINDFSIVSLALLFLLSTTFFIHPLSVYAQLPIIGRTRITIVSLIILAIIILKLWAAEVQCNGASQDRDGTAEIDDIKRHNILILCLSVVVIAIVLHVTGVLEGNGTQKLYFYLYEVLPTSITAPLLPETPLSSTPTKTATASGVTRDNDVLENEAQDGASVERGAPETSSPATPPPSLIVSDMILGYGSHGTVVFRGSFQGRAVAVKRFLQSSATIATREVSILQQSDDHPNVIRYYYHESKPGFFLIALELCPASLADIIEDLRGDGDGGLCSSGNWGEEWREIVQGFDAKRAMRQIASGLRHLHGRGLIHQDIKPQNILISPSSSSEGGGGMGYRMLISDFGLCEKLDVDQTSFLPTASTCSGTTISKTRLTKSVDIFALGCIFYYILSHGGHPYGECFEREVNIIKDEKHLSLPLSTEESTEALDLITCMLHPQPSQRPDIKTCLLHPFFWDPAKCLGFLQDASDNFESLCRDPIDPTLLRLERDAQSVVGNDWYQMLDTKFVENFGKYRKYDGRSVRDLLRALRNKKHHYQDLPADVQRNLDPIPDGFLRYFTRRYPNLFMHVHEVVRDTGLDGESMFKTYFELPES